MKKLNIVTLIISLAIPILVGLLSSSLSSDGMANYGMMNKPPASPPAIVFPIAWTLLYLMMGLASYYIYNSTLDNKLRSFLLILYVVQLAMNFMWSIVFFNWHMYLFAYIWLIVMLLLVIVLAFKAFTLSKTATLLLIPYILWLTFASYLNLGAFLLNR